MAASDKLLLAIDVFKGIDRTPTTGERITGHLRPEVNFQGVAEQLAAAELLVDSDAATRQIEFRLPSSFFLSLDHMLAAPSRRTKVPGRFYLADLDYLHTSDADAAGEPRQVTWYRDAVRAFNHLAALDDHTFELAGDRTLVFLGQSKLTIGSEYGASDLTDLGDLDRFTSDFLESSTHTKQKRTIARAALFDLFGGQSAVPFRVVLASFQKFQAAVAASYELYVAEFSFEKVRAAVEKEKLEFTTKLNKTFADIQNQLLAVPAALILIGGQLEKLGTWTVKNSLIWLGALVFALLMDLLIRNQRNTLSAVKAEIDEQRRQIESEYQAVAGRFADAYQQLEGRYRHQQRLIATVSTLVAVALGAASWLYISYSTPTDVWNFALRVSAIVLAFGWLAMVVRWAYGKWTTRKRMGAPKRQPS